MEKGEGKRKCINQNALNKHLKLMKPTGLQSKSFLRGEKLGQLLIP